MEEWWYHQDGKIGHSWLHFPSQEQQLTTSQGQATTESILEHRGKANGHSCTTDANTDCIKRRKAATERSHCPPYPRLLQHHMALLWSGTTGIAGESAGLNHWKSNCDGEKGGIKENSIWILVDWVHICRAQVVIPTSSFAHLQNKVRDALWPENSVGCHPIWFRSLNKFFWP